MPACDLDESVHVDVLCLKNYHDYILAGIGNYLFAYRNQSLEFFQAIFVSERIHNIYTKNDSILIKGGKQLALVKLESSSKVAGCQFISRVKCSDWIQDLIIFNDCLIGLTTAHNLFEIWNLDSRECVKVSSCNEKCILYSCKIVGNSLDNVIVFGGTIFGEILIWTPLLSKQKSLLQRFVGHNGAVFSIEVNTSEKILSTTSDDRSLRIWYCDTSESLLHPEQWRNLKIQLIHTLYSHTARVWRSLITSNFYVTVGEDSQLIIWRRDGILFKKLLLHQECGIRSVCFSEEANTLFTGGEDGGINAISWKYLSSELKPQFPGKIIKVHKNFTTKVCFVKNGFVYTTSGGCILVSGTEEKFIYNSDNFMLYCLLEVCPGGDCIALGSIKGHIVIINTVNEEVVIEGQYLDGRVYSIHYLDGNILTCGPNGRLDLWKQSTGELELLKVLSLPPCKERWTTCGLVYGCSILIGDRMGNIHVYDLSGGQEPVQSFRKIHSYLGVTHMMNNNGTVFTIGRDGTLKNFTGNLTHSNTYKLPIEWPWKIVFYKGDKLVLGFHSVFFVVWSMRRREIVASLECGGGHRSCHCILNDDKLSFLYVKEKKVFAFDLPLDGMTKVRDGFHGKEINILKIIQTNPPIILTGSEDTTLRISQLKNSKSEMDALHVLRTHTCSIRAVANCFFADDKKILMVSAGGKAQIVLWKFDSKSFECEELINHRLKTDLKLRTSKSVTPAPDPETRFMCIDIIRENNEFLIVVGCSDCHIRLFSYGERSFKLLYSARWTHCVLKVAFLKVFSTIYVASAGTDGRIVFWQVAKQNSTMLKRAIFPIHQSGINCFTVELIEPGKYLLITGGDDNKICVSRVQFSEEVTVNQLWESTSAHACQVTGVKVLMNYLVTTSIDQRVTLWKWSYSENKFDIKYEGQRMTTVPDCQGMDSMTCSDNEILVAVYGKGIELLKFKVEIDNHEKG